MAPLVSQPSPKPVRKVAAVAVVSAVLAAAVLLAEWFDWGIADSLARLNPASLIAALGAFVTLAGYLKKNEATEV